MGNCLIIKADIPNDETHINSLFTIHEHSILDHYKSVNISHLQKYHEIDSKTCLCKKID